MNFALSTLFIFYLSIPGFIFRRFYYSGPFAKEYFRASLADIIFPSLIISALIHIVCIFTSSLIFPHKFPLQNEVIAAFFIDDKDLIQHLLTSLHYDYNWLLLYFLFSSCWAIATGFVARIVVREFRLDRKYSLFRFNNEWHYFFSGEILDFPNMEGDSRNVNVCRIDAVCCFEGTNIIYSGIYKEAVFTSNGGVDRIYLTSVKRRTFNSDNHPPQEANYFLPGDLFCIPFDKILNLHAVYYSIELGKDLLEELNNISED